MKLGKIKQKKKRYAIIERDAKKFLVEKEPLMHIHIRVPQSIYYLLRRKYTNATELITELLRDYFIKEGEILEDEQRTISQVNN